MDTPVSDLPLSFGDWLIIKFLGKGYTSDVYLAEKLGSNDPVVLKIFKSDKDIYLENESRILKSLSHPNIISLKEPRIKAELNRLSSTSSSQPTFSALTMEYAAKGSFIKLIKSLKGLPEDMARVYFLQLLDALDHLHNTCKICHRDIKLDNILLNGEFDLKLSDFGFAREFELPEKEDEGKLVGTTSYLLPEMIERRPYLATSADLFALGITLFGMVSCFLPFESAGPGDHIYWMLKKRKYADFWKTQADRRSKLLPAEPEKTFSTEFKDLINRMLEHNPKQRLCNIKEIKNHPWCRGPLMEPETIATLIKDAGKTKRPRSKIF